MPSCWSSVVIRPMRGAALPGGRVETGETLEQAVVREVAEETGLAIQVVRELGQLNVPDGDGGEFEIHDFLAERIGGEGIAGDDAADIGWFTKEHVETFCSHRTCCSISGAMAFIRSPCLGRTVLVTSDTR
nr:NUDIX domain-containing protein [Ensifer aridi]